MVSAASIVLSQCDCSAYHLGIIGHPAPQNANIHTVLYSQIVNCSKQLPLRPCEHIPSQTGATSGNY